MSKMSTKSTTTKAVDTISMETRSRVNQVGQLLIRAAAALDQVPAAELERLEAITGGPLPAGIRTLLQAATKADPSLAASAATLKR